MIYRQCTQESKTINYYYYYSPPFSGRSLSLGFLKPSLSDDDSTHHVDDCDNDDDCDNYDDEDTINLPSPAFFVSATLLQ